SPPARTIRPSPAAPPCPGAAAVPSPGGRTHLARKAGGPIGTAPARVEGRGRRPPALPGGDRPAPNGPVPPGIMPGNRPRWKDSGSCPEGIGAPAAAPPEHRAAGPGGPPGPAAGSAAVRQDPEARDAGPPAGPGQLLRGGLAPPGQAEGPAAQRPGAVLPDEFGEQGPDLLRLLHRGALGAELAAADAQPHLAPAAQVGHPAGARAERPHLPGAAQVAGDRDLVLPAGPRPGVADQHQAAEERMEAGPQHRPDHPVRRGEQPPVPALAAHPPPPRSAPEGAPLGSATLPRKPAAPPRRRAPSTTGHPGGASGPLGGGLIVWVDSPPLPAPTTVRPHDERTTGVHRQERDHGGRARRRPGAEPGVLRRPADGMALPRPGVPDGEVRALVGGVQR